MSKSNVFEGDVVRLIFHGVAIDNIAVNATVSPLTFLHLALHTADPGEGNAQTTSECTYTGYTRMSVPRDTSGFNIVGNTVTLTADVQFPTRTDSGAGQNVTHWSVGTAPSGAGKILYAGAVAPTISVVQNTAPKLLAATQIVED